ncbi:MAG: heavy metal-binding domain-containing protein [Candidatus Aminicenantes bacterium]
MTKYPKVLALGLVFCLVFVLTGTAQQKTEETVTCAVSGKEIKKSEAKASYQYQGKTYYFCSEKCKDAFVKNPEKYTQKKAEAKEVYTCPMHPEVISDKPGECPQCGMKLEKKMMTKEMMHAHMKKHMKYEHEECCAVMSLMSFKDVEVNVENIENGVMLKVTSENADAVKKMQEMAAKIKEKCTQKKEYTKEKNQKGRS